MNNLPFCHYRYVLNVAYLGTKYHGSQRQSLRGQDCEVPTVQGTLENCLEKLISKQKCGLTSASRTDRGVHALMNVFSLPLIDYSISTSKIKFVVNQQLKATNEDIIVKDVILAPSIFHPRRYCTSREYVYRLAVPRNSELLKYRASDVHLQTGISRHLPVTQLHRVLPLPAQQVVDLLNGEHDFRAFSMSTKPDASTVRNMQAKITVEDKGSFEADMFQDYDTYSFYFKSDSFLRNQVRRMVGAMISYAAYDSAKPEDIKRLLDKPTTPWPASLLIAEPCGLYLRRINYHKSDRILAFCGSKRIHASDEEEELDLDQLEGTSDEELPERRKSSIEYYKQASLDNFLLKQSIINSGCD